MRYDIDILGDRAVRQELDELGERARDLKPAFHAILRLVLAARFRDRFSGQGWQPLAQATAERKSRQGLDPRVMRATGALEAALTSFGRAKGRLQTVGRTTLRVGAGKSLFYARFHQFGTETLPKRELFGWELADRAKALKVLDGYLFGGGKLT